MKSLNECSFIGIVGKDPEIRMTPSGKKVASFSIACNEAFVSNGEKKESTEWISFQAWNSICDVLERYVKKGSKVFCSGKHKTQSWTDQNGITKYKSFILLSNIILLDGKKQNNQNDDYYSQNEEPNQNQSYDDLPF